jgi:hypothetical protein
LGTLDAYLRTHLVDPELLWGDRFAGFLADRQKRPPALIERATGKPVYGGPVAEEGEDVEEEDMVEPTNSSA